MEKLINCGIELDIELIKNISGGNQKFEILIETNNKKVYKIDFDFTWDLRYSIENGYINRFNSFEKDFTKKSSVMIVENSDYIKYFEKQISNTLPTDDLKNYILFDRVDTVIEILSTKEPLIFEIE